MAIAKKNVKSGKGLGAKVSPVKKASVNRMYGCDEDREFCASSVSVVDLTLLPEVIEMDEREVNLSRLSKSPILLNFIHDNSGEWDHMAWLGLCDKIEKAGFAPIDFDKVGLMLEDLKAEFCRHGQHCEAVVL